MTMMTHTHNAHLPQGLRVGAVDAFRAASHVAMIKRFARIALSLALMAAAVGAVIGIKVAVWLPPFHH